MGASSKRSAKQSARAPAPAAARSHARATPPKKTGPRAAPFALRAVLEQLEPRLLLSSDLNPLATEALLATPTPASGSEFRALTDPGHPSAVIAAAVPPIQRTYELVFVDPRVPDRDQLLAGLTGQSADGRRFEVIVLDTTRDGIAQVTAALAERIQIDAVHFISHGTDGAVQLGRTWLDAKTLAANADAVASWGESLKQDADLLFYGCDLAASARGRALVEWIAELTRGDVAASTGVTGSGALGGDWDLEYRRGQIETSIGPSDSARRAWQGILAQTFYLGGDTIPPFSDLETAAPTDAIWDGNNNYDPGRDAEPGLVIQKDNASASQSDPTKHHTWTALAPAGGIVIANEQVMLSLWSAVKDNDPGKEGTITAYLLDMASATATSGTQIAQATVPLKPWSANFAEEVLDFGIVSHTVAAGRYLGIKLVVGNTSDDDLWFAYDATAYPSRLEIGASNAPPVIPPATFNVQENAANGTAVGTVVASDPDPAASFSKIYWTDLTTNEIRRANLDGSGSEVLVAGLQDPTALAVDHLGGKIYWADAGSDRIQRANLDGTNAENLVTTGLSNVVSLKLDLAAGKMYWVDSSARTIQRANLDGSAVQTLLNAAGGVETPTGLDLDVAGGKLYWMENNGSVWSGQIRRANLDGSGATTLITGLRDPWSLSLHVAGGKMYWNDLKADAIARANLDGTGLELIISSVPNVGEVIVDAARSRLLFTDQQNDRLSRSNLDGSAVQTVVGTGAGPAGLDLGPAVPLLTYSITAGNIGGAFAINPVTGAITVANGGALDFETTPSFALTVQAQDAGGSAAAATVIVNVINVNEAPVHSVPGAQSTPEDTALVFAGPLAFSLADPDLGAGLAQVSLAGTNGTLTLGGTIGLSFSVGDGAADATMTFTGTLAAVNTALAGMSFLPTLDFTGAAGITIATSDQGGSGAGGAQIDTDSVAISVTPMNDAPVAIAASASGNEDDAQIAITLTAADLEGPVASFRLNGLPANGLLYADAGLTTLAAIATDYAAAGNALTLYFVPAANWNGTTSFQFTAVDGGGLADATPGNATINVTPLNDAPAGTDGAVATLMNTPRVLAPADFGFTDLDAGDAMSAVRIDGLPLLGTLSVGGIPLLLPGAVVTAAQLAAGDLVFTPLLLTSGTPYASFDFSVADAASVFDPTRNVLTINVLFVNSPPDGTNTSVTTNEDTPYALAVANFGFTDPDAGDSLGAVRIDVLPTAGVLTLLGTPVTAGQIVLAADIAAGRLVFTPAPDASGAPYASFTFSVRDSNGAFDTTPNLLTLTVSPVNDPPVAADNAYAVSEDATLSVPLASAAVLANDTDVDGPALSAVLVAGPANGVLALAPNGTFTYTPNANFYGTDTFTYRAFDGSAGSNIATVTITINNVADNTLVVDTAADTVNGDTTSIDALLANKGVDGLVSLREAILAANATANAGTPDLIHFSIASSGPHTIALAATLPQITDAVVIDGTTEPDFVGTPVIVLDGNGGAGNGLRLAANGSTVRGLAIVDFGQAGVLVSGTGNTIEGNYIGIAADGVTAAGNQTYGVRVNAGGNVIGGTTAAQRNVISGNRIDGLYIAGGSGNVVQGNYVGTNAAGTAEVANREDGIWIDGASNTTVGGTTSGEGNLVSGNLWSGIALSGSGTGNVVVGNRIGLDAAGTVAIANQRHGVDLGSFSGATVGGTAAGAANVIAFNRIEGVSVAAGTGHSILGNSIFANGGLGIDLTSGANSNMNAPVIYSVTVSGGTVTIAGEARPGATVEFFEADPDPSGRGEGRTLLGSGVVSGAVAGAVDPTARRFTFTFAAGSMVVGDRLTATATDGGGSTSEFALNVVTNALPPGIAITPIGGLVTTEDGGIAEFLVVLESEPAADVTIAFSTSDATEGTVAPASLTFTALNWSVAQIVTVTGLADFLTDGTVAYSLVAAAVTSADPGYSGLDPADIALTNVDGVNEAPVNSVPGAQSTAEESALVFTGPLAFSIADSDLGAGLAEVTLAGTHGTLTLGGTTGLSFSVGDGTADASMTFTGTIAAVNTALASMSFLPALDFTGAAAITIATSDQGGSGSGGAQSDTDSVAISVTPVNDAPVANPESYNVTEDGGFAVAAGVGVLANDTDVDGPALTAMLVAGPANGALTLNPDGSFIYFPTANFNGVDTFTYQAFDGSLPSATTTVTITVGAVSDAPAGTDRTVAANEDTVYVFAVADFGFSDTNDTPADAFNAVEIASLPTAGTLTLAGGPVNAGDFVSALDIAAGNLRFTPALNASGNPYASFSFRVQDNGSIANGGQILDPTPNAIMIVVNPVDDLPAAVNDVYATTEDTPLAIAAPGVLANDTGLADGPFTLSVTAGPANGAVVLNNDGSFTYTPAANFFGADGFSYQVEDADGDISTATVSITVDPTDDLPVANGDAYTTGEDTPLAIASPGVLANDTNLWDGGITLSVVGVPVGGTVVLNSDGSFIFTPAADFNGAASFVYQLRDADGDVSTATVGINVLPANDAPAGTSNTVTVNEDSTRAFAAADFGYSDSDGDPLAAVRIDALAIPAGATLRLAGVDVIAGDVIAAAQLPTLVFTPAPDAAGAGYASFTFSVQDSVGTFDGAPETITINVVPVNDTPVAVVDAAATNENTAVTTADVLVNDSLGDEPTAITAFDPLSARGGTVVLNAGNTFTYTPAVGFSGTDTFTYTIQDADGETSTATVTLTVANVANDPPANIVPGAQISAEDVALVFSTGTGNRIALSDPDAGASPLEVTLAAVQGTLTLAGTAGLAFTVGSGTADATMTFTGTEAAINAALDGMSFLPPLDYSGPASVTITTGDLGATGTGGPQSDTDTVNITVVVVDDSPVLDLDADNSSGALGANYARTFTEGNGSVRIADTDASLIDNDSPNLASLTVTITNLLDGLDEVLTADTTGTSITATYVSGSGVLTLNGADTIANYQQVLRTVRYENLSEAPSPAQRIITFVASDGGSASNVGTTTVTINAVNDAPTADIAVASYAATENVTLVLHGTGMSVADIDALPTSIVTVYLDSISGVLRATATNGVGIAGLDSPRLTLTGTLAQINAVLDGTAGTVTYLVGSDSPFPTDTLSLSINDGGATGSGGAQWGWDSTTVNLTAVNDAPLITLPASPATPEDTTRVFSAAGGNQVSITDVDAGGSPVDFTLSVTNGTLTLAGTAGLTPVSGANGTATMRFTGTVAAINAALDGLVFAPATNFNGSASLSVLVDDLGNSGAGGALIDAKIQLISVIAVNDAPSGADASVATPTGMPYTFTLGNFAFTDVDAGDSLSAVRIDSLPGIGTLTLLGFGPVSVNQVIDVADITAGRLVFTPAIAGSTTFTFSVRDTGVPPGPLFDAVPNTVTVNVGVPGISVTPIAGLVTTEAGGTANFSVVLDTQPLADVVITLSSSAATEGTAAPVSLTFTTTDWNVAQSVTVTGVPDGVADGPAAYTIVLASALSADPGYNGLDPSDVAVTNEEVNLPPSVTITQASYTATEGLPLALAGTGISVADPDTANVTVTLAVNAGLLSVMTPLPVAVSGSGTLVTLSGTLADINALLAGGGSINYLIGSDAPAAPDSLTVSISDGTTGASQSVAISLTAVNDAPVNTLPGGSTTLEDTPYVFSAAGGNQISVTDVDVGSAPLEIRLNASNGVITLGGTGGLAFTSGDGTADTNMTFSGTLPAINAALNGLVFTPNLDYNGLAFIQLTTNDLGSSGAGGPLADTDLATIDVLPVNDAPNGTDTTVTLNEDSTYTFGAGDFGFNDVDFGDAMTEVRIESVSLPAGATLMLGVTSVTAGTVIPVAAIGNLVFTPVANANGVGYASFTFSVRDTGVPPGPLFDAVPNTMTVNVTPVNDLPVITSDGGGATAALVVAENTTAVTTATATDIDLQPLTFSLAGVDAALFSIDSVTGVLTFNAAPNLEAPADAGGDNVYNVTVRASDGAGGVDTQALTITVTDANDAPTASGDAYVTDEDLPLSIAPAGVLGNDSDEDGTPITAVLVAGPANGSVAFNADGSFVYTPNVNFFGVDTFTYQATDGALASATATVTITVNPINDAPSGADGNVTVAAAYAFTVADFNYVDVDGDPLDRIMITALPIDGQLLFDGLAVTLNQEVTAAELAAGRLTYVPPTTGGASAASFGFSVSDGSLYEAASHTMAIGFVSAAVTPPPPPPPPPPTITPPPAPPAEPPMGSPPAEGAPAEPGGDAPTGGGRGGGGGSAGGDSAAPPPPPAAEAGAVASETGQAAAGVVATAAQSIAGAAPTGSIGFQSGGVAPNPGVAAPANPLESRGEPPVGEVKAEMETVAAMAAPEVRRALDEARERVQEEAKVEARVAGSVFVVSTGLSVGYVLWLLRGGALIASLLSSLPAWRLVDPLPVLGSMGGRAGDEDDDSLEDLVAEDRNEKSAPGQDETAENDNVGSVRT